MLQEVYEALETRDLVLVLMDATRKTGFEEEASHVPESESEPPGKLRAGSVSFRGLGTETGAPGSGGWASEDKEFLFSLQKLDCPVFLVLTKVDLVRKDPLLPLIDSLTRRFTFAEVIPVSALKSDGLDLLVDKIVAALPTGQRYFPPISSLTTPALHGCRADPREHPHRNRRGGPLRFGWSLRPLRSLIPPPGPAKGRSPASAP